MRTLAIVVLAVAVQHLLKVSTAEDQEPVEALRADGADEAFGVGICLWRPDRRVDAATPSLRNT